MANSTQPYDGSPKLYEESGDIIVNCCSKAKSEKGRAIAGVSPTALNKHWMHGCVPAALEMADGPTTHIRKSSHAELKHRQIYDAPGVSYTAGRSHQLAI